MPKRLSPATRKRQKDRYYRKYSGGERNGTPYSEEEDRLVMDHDIPDRDLSLLIERGVRSIQVRRSTLVKRWRSGKSSIPPAGQGL